MSRRKVLIYRLGSLGDTVVALPSLHLVARAFPNAERRVLTNFPVDGRAAPVSAVIGGSGLVHGYFRYPVGTRSPWELWSLRREIRRWSPDVLVYLTQPRGLIKILRDALFFRTCGIRKLIGVPWSADLRTVRSDHGGRVESEAARLLRCVTGLGEIDLDNPRSWDLRLTSAEGEEAARALGAMGDPYLSASLGTKVPVKDWGEANWTELLGNLSSRFPGLGLVMVGAADEREVSDRAASEWTGPKRNLCGVTDPRISAAVLERSVLFVGHDSGPMHLAAAMGVQCVAVFSARNPRGQWFPFGARHRVIYNRTECSGCGLDVCKEHRKRCIADIPVAEVFDAVCRKLGERNVNPDARQVRQRRRQPHPLKESDNDDS